MQSSAEREVVVENYGIARDFREDSGSGRFGENKFDWKTTSRGCFMGLACGNLLQEGEWNSESIFVCSLVMGLE